METNTTTVDGILALVRPHLAPSDYAHRDDPVRGAFNVAMHYRNNGDEFGARNWALDALARAGLSLPVSK